MDCIKGKANYCFACCEFEFGELVMEKRESCYQTCLSYKFEQDEIDKKKNKNNGYVKLN